MPRPLHPDLLNALWSHAPHQGGTGSDRVAALFRTWCHHLPYDTTTREQHLGAHPERALWGLDADTVVDHALRTGLGVTCFGLTNALCAAALADGHDAAVHLADELDDNGTRTESNHAVCLITTSDGTWLCDPAYLHLQPAPLPTHPTQHVWVGPSWSPAHLWSADNGELHLEVQRGDRRSTRTYRIGAAATDTELAAAYDTAGRWAGRHRAYYRGLHRGHHIAIARGRIVHKGPGGLTAAALTAATAHTQIGDATGLTGDALDAVCTHHLAELDHPDTTRPPRTPSPR